MRTGMAEATAEAAIASKFEHAVLSPFATAAEVAAAARLCLEHRVRGLCVASVRVALASRRLRSSGVRTVAAVGFPSGAVRLEVLREEAVRAWAEGADELDLVLCPGRLRDRDHLRLRAELADISAAVRGLPIKLVLEVSELTDAEIEAAIREVVVPSGAAFLKTGTGVYGRGPLAPERVRWLRSLLPRTVGLKVAGGVCDRETAMGLFDAGADLVGTSRTFEILGRGSG